MGDQRGAAPPDYKATAEKLLSAANDGAKSLKALFFWYVGALAYAVISVAGVTDEQLLKASPLKLPILNVDIPLVEYFAILPLVVVLIHLELLVQFALLSNKVNDFKSGLRHLSADEASDFRLRLENFMLSHLLAGKHNAILHTLLFLLIQGALVTLPLFSLLTIQAQFLAYHSEPMMGWHRILVLIDAAALLYFWPNLFHREDMKAADWLKLMAFRVVPRVVAFLALLAAVYGLLAWFRWPLAEIGVALGLVLVAAIVFSLRASPWRRGQRVIYVAGHHLARWALIPLYLLALVGIAFWIDRAWIARDAPVLTIGTIAALLGAFALARRRNSTRSPGTIWTKTQRWAARSHDLGLRRDAPGMSVFGTQCVLALAASGWLLSIPTENERTVNLSRICWKPVGEPIDSDTSWSEGRWLLAPAIPEGSICLGDDSYLAGDIVGYRASIPAILLNGLGMRRVLVLDEKVLAGQELSPDQRQKLRQGDPDVRNSIEPLDLRGRDLTGIQLNEAVLPRAKFNGRTLLNNASFRQTQLRGASLSSVGLHWTQLETAQLQGAEFEISHVFDGAVLSDFDFSGTSFAGGSFEGAVLNRPHLNGASFTSNSLDTAILIDPKGVEAPQDVVIYGYLVDAPAACLLIVSEPSHVGRPMLNCRFTIHSEANPPSAPPPPDFWSTFWGAQMTYPCLTHRDVQSHMDDLVGLLTGVLFTNEVVQADMARAAIAAAILDECRSGYSREAVAAAHQSLVDEIASETESGKVMTTVRLMGAFYADWLQALDDIEKATSQPAAP